MPALTGEYPPSEISSYKGTTGIGISDLSHASLCRWVRSVDAQKMIPTSKDGEADTSHNMFQGLRQRPQLQEVNSQGSEEALRTDRAHEVPKIPML